jgi:phosphatidylglycerophosphate synthase
MLSLRPISYEELASWPIGSGGASRSLVVGGEASPYSLPSLPDVVTLTSMGLGIWWTIGGGPLWAGLLSILGDEIDGRLARAMDATSERGSNLDWGSDVALTSLSLVRLGREWDLEKAGIVAAPLVFFAQAAMRTQGFRPAVGSARAVAMIAAMLTPRLRAFLKGR